MDGGKGLRHGNAECAPLLPSSQLRPALGAGGRGAGEAGSPGRAALSAPASPGEPSKTQGTRRARPGRCAARRCEANAFGSSSSSVPPATQAGARPGGGGALPRGRRGHPGRAPRPEDAAPAWSLLALLFREDGSRPSEETTRVGPASSSQPRFLFSPGRRHGVAQRRTSPLTRPTCLPSAWVTSLIHLPERPETAASQAGSPPPSPM